MRLLNCLIAAILATSVSAAPEKFKRSNLGLPEGAYWENDNVLVIRNDPITAEELDEYDRLDELEAPAQSERMSDSTLSARKDPDKWADIRMTGDMQPVGTLRGMRLYRILYDCFSTLCKISDGLRACFVEKGYTTPSCKIKNIVSNRDKDGTYYHDDYLTLSFKEIKHTPEKVDLDLATYQMVSAVYRDMTKLDYNCYYVDFKDSRKTKLCNVVGEVLVAFPIQSIMDDPHTLYIATLTSSVKEKEGDYKCNPEMLVGIENSFKNDIKPKFASSTGVGNDDIGLNLHCVDQHDLCMSPTAWKKCVEYWKKGSSEHGEFIGMSG